MVIMILLSLALLVASVQHVDGILSEIGGVRGSGARRKLQTPDHCGCFDCTDEVWNTYATNANGNYTCGQRIIYVRDELKNSEEDACRRVAGRDFPLECGRACNPARCDGRLEPFTASPTVTPLPGKLVFDTSMYCYPEYDDRVRWTDAWGDFIIEVKQDGALCGPSDNNFVADTVSFDAANDELTLEFKQVNGVWSASEVRVVLPDSQMPYQYGNYKFGVKSVKVYNGDNDSVVSDILPQSLVIGLFTWDTTERYELRENYNHEVDIEISRWNIADNKDAQFLVQPPEEPQYYRFHTGGSPSLFDQSGHTWEFTWNPNNITWFSTVDGGISHEYSSKQAIELGTEDRIQCLPADVELRFNLWNFLGTSTPTGMNPNERVEVVIDQLTYTPSGETAVPNGGTCSKTCQCEASSQCISGICIHNTPEVTASPIQTSQPSPSPTVPPTASPINPIQTSQPSPFPTFPPTASPINEPGSSPTMACSANFECAGLAGDCCPTSHGTMLGCCDSDPGACLAHSQCAGLAGACCPTPDGTMLGCCDSDPGACSAHPQCAGLAGACCPTSDGTTLGCCDSNQGASCSAHPQCAGLAGDCCPTPGGTTLGCCDSNPGACSAHPQCAGLAGDCCPTSDGTTLGCCDSNPGACSAHPRCDSLGLVGDCCPTLPGGILLGCCD